MYLLKKSNNIIIKDGSAIAAAQENLIAVAIAVYKNSVATTCSCNCGMLQLIAKPSLIIMINFFV